MATNIYKTTAQVTVFSTVEKTLSFAYRIILSRLMGAEGMGIYQIALTVFALLLTASSSGIPVTVSRLITKQNALGNTAAKGAVVTAGIVGTMMFTVPACAVIFALRGVFGGLFSDGRCLDVFLILLPGLIITSVYAVMRGALWGDRQFLPYSVIELAEDAVMVVAGSVLVAGAADAADGARRAAMAVFVSYIFSFICSLALYFKRGGKLVSPRAQLKPLLSSALPITAMRTSSSLLNFLVAVLMPLLLVQMCGYTDAEAVSLYGIAAGMAVPVLFTPSSLIGSIAVVLAPELSENYYRNRTELLRADIRKALRAAIFIAFALIPLLFALGNTVGDVLFSDGLSGQIIKNCSFVLLPMCISMMTSTVLNSLNRERATLIFYLIGAGAMLAVIAAFTTLIGVYAYVAGLGASLIITAALNMRLLRKLCPRLKLFGYFARCASACALCCTFGAVFMPIIEGIMPPVACLFAGGAAIAAFTALTYLAFGTYSLAPVIRFFTRKRAKGERSGGKKNIA